MTSRAPPASLPSDPIRPKSDPTNRSSAPQDRSAISILVVDDDRPLREGCAGLLAAEGFIVAHIGSGHEALDLLSHRPFDIVFVDLYMTPVTGTEVLAAALAANRRAIVVMMTGKPSVGSSIDALRRGAWDYLPKPFAPSHLQVLAGRAACAILSNRPSADSVGPLDEGAANGRQLSLLGAAPAFQDAVDLARRVAVTDATVMITGESGTGKEVIAHFIHMYSRRADRVLVPINCAALPEPLLESEMFGHRKGSFTGANRDKPGLLEVANGGTLFLDELTEMSHPIQSKLLRVLQDGVVRRVGSETQDAVVDVRFISATNRDPEDAVNGGILREDLYYRLGVVPIHLPPLRERLEDIPLLANHFLEIYWRRHRRPGETMPVLTEAATDFLCGRTWPGNVRELQNLIEHLAVLCEPGQRIAPADFPASRRSSGGHKQETTTLPVELMSENFYTARERLVSQFEKEYLARLVGRAGRNMSKAARLASIDRTTLYRLLEKHGTRSQEAP